MQATTFLSSCFKQAVVAALVTSVLLLCVAPNTLVHSQTTTTTAWPTETSGTAVIKLGSHNGYTYEAHTGSFVNWNDARSSCQARGLDLATAYDSDSWSYILSMIGTDTSTYYHVGAYVSSPTSTKSSWTWIATGTQLTYTSAWASSQPNADGSCGRVVSSTLWDGSCSSTYIGNYICSSYPSTTSTTTTSTTSSTTSSTTTSSTTTTVTTVTAGGSFRELEYDGRRYEFHDYTLSATDAQAVCSGRDMNLATIYNSAVNSFINTNRATTTTTLTIGGYAESSTSSSSLWKWWSTGTYISNIGYSNWASAQPNADGTALRMGNGGTESTWWDGLSSTTRHFVCSNYSLGTTTSTSTTTSTTSTTTSTTTLTPSTTTTTATTITAGGSVRYGTDSNGIEYEFHDYTRTWSAARTICQGRGKDLVTIDSSVAYSFVQGMRTSTIYTGAYADSATSSKSLWKWAETGNVISYTSVFASGQPNADGTCGRLDSSGLWDGGCTSNYYFACSGAASSGGTTSTAAGTTITAGGSVRYLSYDSVSYEFHDYTKSWSDAEAICVGRNMHLATSYSSSVDAWMESQMSSSSNYAHIGGFSTCSSACSSSNWKWKSTGTYISNIGYSNWYSSSYPSSYSAQCMHMYKYSSSSYGSWFNGGCSYNYRFICSNHNSGSATSTTDFATTVTAGGTVRYRSYYDSGADRYISFEFHDYGRSWSAARAICQGRGVNMDLTPIWDSSVWTYMKSLISSTTWVGGYASSSSSSKSNWRWIDSGNTMTYHGFWSSSQPNGDGTCVRISSDSGWDGACTSTSYYFVCSDYDTSRSGSNSLADNSTASNVGLIVGATFGGVIGLILIIVIAVFCYGAYCRSNSKESATANKKTQDQLGTEMAQQAQPEVQPQPLVMNNHGPDQFNSTMTVSDQPLDGTMGGTMGSSFVAPPPTMGYMGQPVMQAQPTPYPTTDLQPPAFGVPSGDPFAPPMSSNMQPMFMPGQYNFTPPTEVAVPDAKV